MALKIQTTGIEQYAPGGQAVLKTMFIGGPGAGKTRLSSYWPKPLYADVEGGLASIADRAMPFVTINNSQDMLDLLAFLRMECRRPVNEREYRTIVIDTLDAFQRKVKDEWLQQNPTSQSFRGFDAWGYLETKMQMLLTRLLNLDMNVIVCVHFKDKTIREGTGENATERQELMLQLSGDVKDNVFNDFDLVGWLGKYYEAVDGQRVEKRGLTFTSTPDKPFLKDRLHVTPKWMEVHFSDEDYAALFSAFVDRLDELKPGQDIGEIPSMSAASPLGQVVAPGDSGPLPAAELAPLDVPLNKFDKATLQQMARDMGISFQQNTIKAELIQAIEAERANAPAQSDSAPESAAEPAAAAAPAPSQAAAEVPAAPAPATPVAPAPAAPAAAAPEASQPDVPAAPAVADAPATPVTPADISTEVGQVDPSTGEIVAPMTEAQVASALGGQITSVDTSAEAPEVPPAPAVAQTPSEDDLRPMALVDTAPAAAAAPPVEAAPGGRPSTCEECGKALAGENQDYVKLSQIKYRKYLCNADYLARKKAS